MWDKKLKNWDNMLYLASHYIEKNSEKKQNIIS
jgi:hypothetical protein